MLTIIAGVLMAMGDPVKRPRDPWVFRCVLDKRPRMVAIALHESLWVAYDATTCGMYKAWRGDVKFQGAVYDHVHGPQPVARGQTILDEPPSPMWTVKRRGKPVESRVAWKGYRIQNDQVTLLYELTLEDGTVIQAQERIDARQTADDTVELEREFHLEGVPEGVAVITPLHVKQAGGERIRLIGENGDVECEDGSLKFLNVALIPYEPTKLRSVLKLPVEKNLDKKEGGP